MGRGAGDGSGGGVPGPRKPEIKKEHAGALTDEVKCGKLAAATLTS